MLISLPIKHNEKCINIVFYVIYLDNKYIIKPYNNINNIIHVITYSHSYGINTVLVNFPLFLTPIDNILHSDLFYIIKTLSYNNSLPNCDDFFYTLLNSINSFYNKTYTYFDINHKYIPSVSSLNTIYYKTTHYLNQCLYYIYNQQQPIEDIIIKIIKKILLIKINFYGSIKCIEEHIIYIINMQTITNIQTIKWSKFTTIFNLIAHLILFKYTNLIDITVNELYESVYCDLLLSLYNKDKLFILSDVPNIITNLTTITDLTHVNELTPQQYIYNNISFNKFTDIINTHTTFDINILNNLFASFIYPLNYNKKTVTVCFAKILMYSFKFYTHIINEQYQIHSPHDTEELKNNLHINNKIKIPYICILKQYKAIDTQDISMYYNTRVYIDPLINTIIKILLFNDNYNLFSNLANQINKYQKIFIENTIIVNILSNITWKTISKQILLLKHVIDAKHTHGQLFIVDGNINKIINKTINKTINNLLDYRLKKIIIEPLHMFSYLRKEADYYRWTVVFKELIGKIFYNPIILNSEDYIKLSKTIYLLSKITVQNIENPEYNKLLNYLNKHPRIIFFNDRINIKIKDLFKNNNLNFGFLTKHINEYSQPTISITDTIDDHINTITRKYYKYKVRYLEMTLQC